MDRACPEIEWNGRVWKVGHPTGRAKEILNSLVIAQASAPILALKESLPASAYAEILEDFRINLKSYQPWGKGWLAEVQGADGGPLFLLSLLRLHQAGATMDDARGLIRDCGDEVTLALKQVMPDFFLVLVTDPRIPEAKRPELVKTMTEQLNKALQPPTPISDTNPFG